MENGPGVLCNDPAKNLAVFSVKRSDRVIEEQDWWTAHHGPRQSQPLAFTDGNVPTLFCDPVIKSVGKGIHKRLKATAGKQG
ncbi:hypothetical protein GCM10022269_17590 [Sphingorhabdus rigui]